MKKIFSLALLCVFSPFAFGQSGISQKGYNGLLWVSVGLLVVAIVVGIIIYSGRSSKKLPERQPEHPGDEYEEFHSTYP